MTSLAIDELRVGMSKKWNWEKRVQSFKASKCTFCLLLPTYRHTTRRVSVSALTYYILVANFCILCKILRKMLFIILFVQRRSHYVFANHILKNGTSVVNMFGSWRFFAIRP